MSDWSSIDSILRDSRSFVAPWKARLQGLGGSQGTSAIAQECANERSFVEKIVLGPHGSLKEFACYVERKTIESIRKSSSKISGGYEVDIVNGVAIFTWTISVARLLGIPLKAPGAAQAIFDVGSLQDALTTLFRYVFSSSKLSSVQELGLRRDALLAYQQLSRAIGDACKAIKCSSIAQPLLHRHYREGSDEILSEHGSEVLRRLFSSGRTVDEVVTMIAFLAIQSVIPSVFAVSVRNAPRLLGADNDRSFVVWIFSCQNLTTLIGKDSSNCHRLMLLGCPKSSTSTSSKLYVFSHLLRLASAPQTQT